MTEAPTEGLASEEVVAAPHPWLGTADHKRLGLLFLLGSLVFLVLGGVAGAVLRAELLAEGRQLDVPYGRVFSLHVTVSSLLFLPAAWLGLATWLVPLQIGSSRLAFPRLHAFALWVFLLGGSLLLAAYVIGTPLVDLASSTPEPSPEGGAGTATSLAVVAMGLVAVSTVLASMDLAVTVLKLRARGLTLRRLPFFSWATLVTGLATLLATPVFFAGLILLYLDRHFGGQLFAADGVAGKSVWRHSLWLFGRPEAYLALLPGLGAACDVVGTHAGRPLRGSDAARGAMVALAALSFGAWAAGGEVADALVLPTYSPLSALVAVPAGVVALVLLRTALEGRPRLHPSLLFVGGALALAGFGALHVVVAAVVGVQGGAWTTGHLHTVTFGAPSLLLFAALYHWAPKMLGRHPSPRLAASCFLGLFGGFLLLGLGSYLLGYDGTPAHRADYPFGSGTSTFSGLAFVGAALLTAGVLAFLVDVLRTTAWHAGEEAGDDPYQGLTLEWAAPSPPPPHNFDSVPEVRSAQPLLDLREPAESSRG